MIDDRSTYETIEPVAHAIERGEPVVYPTETVYGLGANALDSAAIRKVFALKGRPRDRPLSLAVGAIDRIDDVARPSERDEQFMRAFLPGPVTVLVDRREVVPDELVAGGSKVGVRIPDHDLARALADRCGPITATSANESGDANAREVGDLAPAIREGVGAILDGGRTPGGESTVVDVRRNELVRRGIDASRIETWLAEH